MKNKTTIRAIAIAVGIIAMLFTLVATRPEGRAWMSQVFARERSVNATQYAQNGAPVAYEITAEALVKTSGTASTVIAGLTGANSVQQKYQLMLFPMKPKSAPVPGGAADGAAAALIQRYHGVFMAIDSPNKEANDQSIYLYLEWDARGHVHAIDWLGLVEDYPLRQAAEGALWAMSRKLEDDQQLAFTINGYQYRYKYTQRDPATIARKLIGMSPNVGTPEDSWTMQLSDPATLAGVESVTSSFKLSSTAASGAQKGTGGDLELTSKLTIRRLDKFSGAGITLRSDNTSVNARFVSQKKQALAVEVEKIKTKADLLAKIKDVMRTGSFQDRDVIGAYLVRNYSAAMLLALLNELTEAEQAMLFWALEHTEGAAKLLSELLRAPGLSEANQLRAVVALGGQNGEAALALETLQALASDNGRSDDVRGNALIQSGRLYSNAGPDEQKRIEALLNSYAQNNAADKANLLYAMQATHSPQYLDTARSLLFASAGDSSTQAAASALVAEQAAMGNPQALQALQQGLLTVDSSFALSRLGSAVTDDMLQSPFGGELQDRARSSASDGVRAQIMDIFTANAQRCSEFQQFLHDARNQANVSDNIKENIGARCPAL